MFKIQWRLQLYQAAKRQFSRAQRYKFFEIEGPGGVVFVQARYKKEGRPVWLSLFFAFVQHEHTLKGASP